MNMALGHGALNLAIMAGNKESKNYLPLEFD
jgi:hypothetical protein